MVGGGRKGTRTAENKPGQRAATIGPVGVSPGMPPLGFVCLGAFCPAARAASEHTSAKARVISGGKSCF